MFVLVCTVTLTFLHLHRRQAKKQTSFLTPRTSFSPECITRVHNIMIHRNRFKILITIKIFSNNFHFQAYFLSPEQTAMLMFGIYLISMIQVTKLLHLKISYKQPMQRAFRHISWIEKSRV